MASRLDLQSKLETILGSRNVYYQPPSSNQMKYPCIKYELSAIDTKYADDTGYALKRGYQMILIDKNPDSEFIDKLMVLPFCKFDRAYKADNLNHFVFSIYF